MSRQRKPPARAPHATPQRQQLHEWNNAALVGMLQQGCRAIDHLSLAARAILEPAGLDSGLLAQATNAAKKMLIEGITGRKAS